MIKNIILDMGNVLLDYNPRKILDRCLEKEEEKERIYRELFKGYEWYAGDMGAITNKERYDLVKRRLPEELHTALYRCVNEWFDTMTPIAGASEFVDYLKDKGYRIYILSNACNGFYEYFPKFRPLEFFDGVVVSSDLHVVKPARPIYEYLLQKYDLRPEESLFVDDQLANVKGAELLGIHGFVFKDDYEAVKKEIVNLK